MTRKIPFLIFLVGIALFILISNIVSYQARAADIDTTGCFDDCVDKRDFCIKTSAVQEITCTNRCTKQAGYGWDYSNCLQNAENSFKSCKSLAEEKTKEPFYVRIFLRGRTLENCINKFQKDQQNCRDKKVKSDSCLDGCKNEQQARYNKCISDFNDCVGKCPGDECKTDEDCDEKSGNTCAIGTCASVDLGRASSIRRFICSYSYKAHGTCCPDEKTGPHTCQTVGLSRTTCTGGPCGDRDDDGILDREDNCPDSPGVYTGDCPKEPTQQTTPTFLKKIYKKIKNIIFPIFSFSKPNVSSFPPETSAPTPAPDIPIGGYTVSPSTPLKTSAPIPAPSSPECDKILEECNKIQNECRELEGKNREAYDACRETLNKVSECQQYFKQGYYKSVPAEPGALKMVLIAPLPKCDEAAKKFGICNEERLAKYDIPLKDCGERYNNCFAKYQACLCGNNKVDQGEDCDPPVKKHPCPTGRKYCDKTCHWAIDTVACGDSCVDKPTEECEKDKDCAQGFKCCPESCKCFLR